MEFTLSDSQLDNIGKLAGGMIHEVHFDTDHGPLVFKRGSALHPPRPARSSFLSPGSAGGALHPPGSSGGSVDDPRPTKSDVYTWSELELTESSINSMVSDMRHSGEAKFEVPFKTTSELFTVNLPLTDRQKNKIAKNASKSKGTRIELSKSQVKELIKHPENFPDIEDHVKEVRASLKKKSAEAQ